MGLAPSPKFPLSGPKSFPLLIPFIDTCSQHSVSTNCFALFYSFSCCLPNDYRSPATISAQSRDQVLKEINTPRRLPSTTKNTFWSPRRTRRPLIQIKDVQTLLKSRAWRAFLWEENVTQKHRFQSTHLRFPICHSFPFILHSFLSHLCHFDLQWFHEILAERESTLQHLQRRQGEGTELR